MSLAWIPRAISSCIQRICSRFLWNGNREGKTFAWIKWDRIALPKKSGGWGIKNMDIFSKPLAAKMGWEIMTYKNLSMHVIYMKYIWPMNITDWIWLPSWIQCNISSIWKVFITYLQYIINGLTWRIRSGNEAHIGINLWSRVVMHTLYLPIFSIIWPSKAYIILHRLQNQRPRPSFCKDGNLPISSDSRDLCIKPGRIIQQL